MTRGKKRIYLRAYADPSEAIEHYFQILSSAKPYKSLRQARRETDDPFELVKHLQNFSEKREAYTNQLKKMIVANNFTQYDHYKIDPIYIVEEEVD
jgi:Bax protein